MDKALVANILIIVLEIMGLYFARSRVWMMLVLYTQLSNLITLVSSVCFIISRDAAITTALRYLSTVMLTMTVLITLFVLVPLGAGFRNMMLSEHGLFHHTLCPAVSITSYMLWEPHSSLWGLPIAVTAIYGVVLLWLNYTRKVEGPYPFFMVHKQSVKATVLWMAALILLMTSFSFGIRFLAK